MHIGLDFGTTNTVVAVSNGTDIQYLPLQPDANNPIVMPSVLYIGREGELLIGQAAIDRYLAANLERDVIYEQRFLGQIEMHFASTEGTQGQDVHVIRDVYANVDASAPGRLFQSLKLALADEFYVSTDVYGVRWTPEELVATLLREIRRRVEFATNETVEGVVLGYPVHYGVTAEQDALAMQRMRRACDLAGLPHVEFLLEPIAAAYAYAAELQEPRKVFVFDFGGGTVDMTVMELKSQGSHEVLAVEGAVVGGDTLNSRIVTGALARYFGEGAQLGAQRLPLPAFLLESLADWQRIMGLRSRRSLQIIDEAINTGDRPVELKALRSLVHGNYGLQLYREVEQAKCYLSEELQTVVGMNVSDIRFSHTLTRGEFEMVIASEVRKVGVAVDRALQAAGLRPEQIDTVLLAGGSSRIPRFVRLLAERFGADRLHHQDAFTSIVAGLSIAAYNAD